jgi:hypothetical protein
LDASRVSRIEFACFADGERFESASQRGAFHLEERLDVAFVLAEVARGSAALAASFVDDGVVQHGREACWVRETIVRHWKVDDAVRLVVGRRVRVDDDASVRFDDDAGHDEGLRGRGCFSE